MLGGTESGAFVNGILHKIAQKLRPKSPQPTPFPQTEN
jgi:transcription termination factor NusB